MYEITVQRHFDAAHFLKEYGGKCEALHGHRFLVAVSLKAKELNEIGIVYDFVALKKHLDEIIGRWDHTSLNEVPPFTKINPSSENIARTLYEELKPKLAKAPATISRVQVWESPEAWVIYTP